MFPSIPVYKTDFTGENPDNRITKEYYKREAGVKNPLIVLRSGPFYQRSVRVFKTKDDTTELVKGKDFEFYGICKSLTKYVKNQTVGIMIKLIGDSLDLSEFYVSYQVVGNFSIVSADLIDQIQSAVDDERPVYFKDVEGMPKWFPPELHKHDIRYEIHSFVDLADQIKRINTEVMGVLPNRDELEIEHFYNTIIVYIDSFKKALADYVKRHTDQKVAPLDNAHGLTAKQVNLDLVDNFETASYIQVLEGIREDLHVTADIAKRVIDGHGKASDSLFKKGLLPIIRYGSNNFIPPGIDGSFEGMGQTAFAFGCGVESDGTGLVLTGRNDGRAVGLYFIKNTTIDYATSGWEFTAYKYNHPQATDDGNRLVNILNGSDPKFLVIGEDGKQWYWTYGNGTFDPTKHVLNKIPYVALSSPDCPWLDDAYQQPLINATAQVITAKHPNKVYIIQRISGSTAWGIPGVKEIAFQGYPTDGSSISPVAVNNMNFVGFFMWELDVKTSTWKRIKYNYRQVGETKDISSYFFCPHVVKLEKGYQRKDRDDYANVWSITQFRHKYTNGINYYNERYCSYSIAMYDDIEDRMAFHFYSSGYGRDSSPAEMAGGYSSIGYSLENFTEVNGWVEVDVNPGYKMDTIPVWNNTSNTANTSNPIAGISYYGYGGEAGSMGYGQLKPGYSLTYGTSGYGTLPGVFQSREWSKTSSFVNYDTFYKTITPTSGTPGCIRTSYSYNESNPVGLSIGMHSDSYILPDVEDPDTYGVIFSISYPGIKHNLGYRKTKAIDKDLKVIPPDIQYNLFNNPTLGYPLDNDVRLINYDYWIPFLTFSPIDRSSIEEKKRYYKYMMGYHSVSIGQTSITPNNINKVYHEEVQFQMGSTIEVNVLKAIDISEIFQNFIYPSIVEYCDTTHPDYFTGQWEKTASLTPCCLEGDAGNLLLFGCDIIGPTGRVLRILRTLRITELEEVDSVGIVSESSYLAKNIEFVGDWQYVSSITVHPGNLNSYLSANTNYSTSKQVGGEISPRGMVQQQADGSSVVIWNSSYTYPVVGNSNTIGVIVRVDETGIRNFALCTNYRTAGQYTYCYHPYYGKGTRVVAPGAAQIGYGYSGFNRESGNNYSILLNNTSPSFRWLGVNNYIEGAFTVYFKAPEDIIVGGTPYTLPAGYIDLFDIDPSPQNKTFYCYIVFGDNGPEYQISANGLAETPSQALIAVITTGPDNIITIEPMNVFTMNGYRISSVRHGATIPASTGSIDSPGQTTGWADNDADLSGI